MPKNTDEIITKLSDDIADTVGNGHMDDIDSISASFNKTLIDALHAFNSTSFDQDGFIKKMASFDIDDNKDKSMMKNILNNVRSDYINIDALNQSELLLRRDIHNICTQMPEMHDVINVIRDSVIECNIATGEVSRSITFENQNDDESAELQVKEFERKYDLLMAQKNFILPNLFMHGENCIHVVPYAKLFAELELVKMNKYGNGKKSVKESKPMTEFVQSIPDDVKDFFCEDTSLYNDENLKLLTESVSTITKVDNNDINSIENSTNKNIIVNDATVKTELTNILKNINIYKGTTPEIAEFGEGFREVLMEEFKRNGSIMQGSNPFLESIGNQHSLGGGVFKDIDQDDIDISHYKDIKGAYIKYLDGLKLLPIRVDRKIVGYFYTTTNTELETHPKTQNGVLDLSYQNYTKDQNMVDTLATIIIRNFDRKILEKNVHLKSEIAEIIMAHKFSEGKLSFVYIPETDIVRLAINEDENGMGHSILEPSLFPARMYLMLTLYNMLYTLNNNTIRVHYIKSSGLNKDYAAQIQRAIRKFQSRRISIDDIYSYSGVMNKIGGMGELVLPAGRNDFKAMETDTIEAVQNPINIEFLEQQRRQAISGTGVPHLLVINAIDEVDFAKTLELANTRFLSTVSSYKIDANKGMTKLYQLLARYCTTLDEDTIQSLRFSYNPAKQQELNITTEMISSFNSLVEVIESIYYDKSELEDDQGRFSPRRIALRKELAREYLPQLNIDHLDDVVKKVELIATDDLLQKKVNGLQINSDDIAQVES